MRVRSRLPRLLDGHRHVVVDTPPGDMRIVRAAIEAGDIVRIPTRPTLLAPAAGEVAGTLGFFPAGQAVAEEMPPPSRA